MDICTTLEALYLGAMSTWLINAPKWVPQEKATEVVIKPTAMYFWEQWMNPVATMNVAWPKKPAVYINNQNQKAILDNHSRIGLIARYI